MLFDGYHYTSLQNWQRIETEGLLPYRLDTPSPGTNRAEMFKRNSLVPAGGLHGIWVFRFEPEDEASHVGNILFHALSKRTPNVVKLRVQYPADDVLLRSTGEPVVAWHTGIITDTPEDWTYHEGEPALIVTKPIPPSRIELLGTYDIPAMAREARGEAAA